MRSLTPLLLLFLLTFTTFAHASYPSTINKLCVSWGWDYEVADAEFMADHFDMVIFSPEYGFEAVHTIENLVKTYNPNVTTLAYRGLFFVYTGYSDWTEVNAHEDWFLHTAGGDRIQDLDTGGILMDVSVQGWREHLCEVVESSIDVPEYTYDGFYADYAANTYPTYLNENGTVPQAKIDSWHTDTAGILAYIDAYFAENMTDKLFIYNADSRGNYDYIDNYGDGCDLEGYIHPIWEPDSYSKTPEAKAQDEADLEYVTQTIDKICLARSGTETYPVQTGPGSVLQECYDSFVAYSDGSGYWAFNDWFTPEADQAYYSIMDNPLNPDPTQTPAPYVPPSTSLGSGSGFDTLVAFASVLAVFAIIIWPFIPKNRRPF